MNATSVKLEDKEKRDSKSERNLLRSKPFIHLKMVEQNQDLDINKFYSELYKKYSIPKTINVGQTWGWEFGDNFVHFEIQDYIYFLDIITKVLESYNLNKTLSVMEVVL